MSVLEFAADLNSILHRSPLYSERPLRWLIIANPKAGGFTIKRRWQQHEQALNTAMRNIEHYPIRQYARPARLAEELDSGDGSLGKLGLLPTQFPGHACQITQKLLDEIEAELADAKASGQAAPFWLLICAGGDGTGLEAMTMLYHMSSKLRSSMAILRLPMGTGNDGADARELSNALKLLTEPASSCLKKAIILKTATAGKGPFLAFNILSIGLDAFVTHMTNKMKGKMPGDSYKLWVDIASLLYDKLWNIGPMKVSAKDAKGQIIQDFEDTLLLLAMGASGRRTYGSNKKILPDERNACAIQQMPLLRKFALKSMFMDGGHSNAAEARLFTAETITVDYQQAILAQMDGETVELQPEDFPIVLQLSEACIPCLKPAP